ncbi:MAG: TetR/AcrR family transcriptional regulator [SAR86 cluster bacterium]|jgi:AcrR family transcriptional regulator|uniref:TetR/AcrR family transcriptional regulator n=1 Tax=SAR86 cluster bacterium TaxID=2030880 RepID=A0A972VXV1_9GAMM|nr:TetR/AcrR family transcriptional regulator [SAR86 cluster bacterium]
MTIHNHQVLSVRPDPRVVRTEAAIKHALLEQLAAGCSFSALTVSEISLAAGVTRKTFYARFGSPEQVVERIVTDLFDEIIRTIDDDMLRLPLLDNSLAMMVFRAYDEHQSVLAPLVRYCPVNLFVGPVSTIAGQLLERAIKVNKAPPMDEARQAYLVATIASIVHGVVSVWVKRGFSESPEQVASFVDELLTDGIQRIVLSATKGWITG